jgi:hypothetical protein
MRMSQSPNPMNEQISLAFSVQPDGTASAAFSAIPTNIDGSLNTDGMKSANIYNPTNGSPEAALLSAVSAAISTFKTAKGF